MDALLSAYASSSDEEEDHRPPPHSKPSSVSSSSTSSLFSSLPKPKPQSSSSFSQPLKQTLPKNPSNFLLDDDDDLIDSKSASKPSSVFSSLPPPKTLIPKQPITNLSPSAAQTPKRVVQFKPPMLSQSLKSSQFDDEDDDKQDEERRRRKAAEEESSAAARTSSGLSRFSLPAPKYSAPLGGASLGSGYGSGRRAIVDTESVGSGVESNFSSGLDRNVASSETHQSNIDPNVVNYESNRGYESYQSGIDQNAVNNESYGAYENYQSGIDQNAVNGSDASTYGSYDGYGSYGGYEQYGTDLVGRSGTVMPVAIAGTGASGINVSKKRGRNEVPTEIIEVKQDELMKNRPREDQAKSTGIAFGPSYQPVSTKGQPSKLHKRKHQISSLYFDMRQKEMELAERRSRGFLTKAETQAKYGW